MRRWYLSWTNWLFYPNLIVKNNLLLRPCQLLWISVWTLLISTSDLLFLGSSDARWNLRTLVSPRRFSRRWRFRSWLFKIWKGMWKSSSGWSNTSRMLSKIDHLSSEDRCMPEKSLQTIKVQTFKCTESSLSCTNLTTKARFIPFIPR